MNVRDATKKGERIMRKLLTLGIAGVVFASTSVALAQSTRWAWTEKKAERIVARDATVQLQASERATLENELLASVRLYNGLAFAARDVGDAAALGTFESLAYRFRAALEDVRGGLEIEAAACRGAGKALKGQRFTRFQCAVTSEVLEIPTAELSYPEGAALPTVVEGAPRMLGPWQARLDVRVTGSSAIAYRAM
jgi:hypothetical protein